MDQVWLFWGEPHLSDSRPEAVALQSPPYFAKKSVPWALYPYALQISREEARGLFEVAPIPVDWLPVEPQVFADQFEKIQKSFAKKDVDKVVPYLFEEGTVQDRTHFLEHFIGNSLRFEKGFLYGRWRGEKGEIGLSPEVLISQINEHQFATMALAGTCPMDQWELNPDQFKEDPKEKLEHQKVIEDIVNQLKGLGNIDVHDTQIVSATDLVHMLTPIELKTSHNVSLEKLIDRLHPTAALGGFPRLQSQTLLRQIDETLPRDRFGAPFSVSYSPRSADVIVSIRGLTWNGDKIKMGAGCGVVPQSEYEKELNELKFKRESIKKVFGVL